MSERKKYEITSTSFTKNNSVIATAVNNYAKSNTWQKQLSISAGLSEHRIFLHSEVSCLIKSRRKVVHSLLVQRFDSLGNPKLAKPCLSCMLAIRAFNVKFLRYTTEDGIKEEIL